MIGLLLQSKIARQIGAILVFIIGVITFGQLQKRKGKKAERAKQERADSENANYIRDRVRDAKRVPNQPHKFRD